VHGFRPSIATPPPETRCPVFRSKLTFAIAASTGASDVHEINRLTATTANDNPLTTLDMTVTDNGTGPTPPDSVGLDVPFTYTLTPSVDINSSSEAQLITTVDHLPAGEVLVPPPPALVNGWDCSASDVTTNTVECTYPAQATPILAGTTLPSVS
jgi:hypothetical protein